VAMKASAVGQIFPARQLTAPREDWLCFERP
jgi:hypothetical protein